MPATWRQRVLLSVSSLALVLTVIDGVAAAAAAAAVEPPSSVNLFVSPSGNDADDGSLTRPFRSLPRVQREVRARKRSSQLPVNVFLRGGRYELVDTLEFAPEDAGGAASTVTYQAYCDAAVESSLVSVQPYPYRTHLPTPPRLLWNGNGDSRAWTGPMNPFLEMEINRTSNSLVTTQPPAPPLVAAMDIGDVCVDKAVTGGASGGSPGGHTCYSGAIATCVSGCKTACTSHLERKTYSPEFGAKFSHLFGKKLDQDEDCVERCALSCRGCEQATISGAKRIAPGELSSWSLYKNVPLADGALASIFRADLTSFLPATGAFADAADNPTVFSTLYVDDVQLPRAGYPDCRVGSDLASSLTEFDCAYATPQVTVEKSTIQFNATSFSPRVAQWTNVPLTEVEVLPCASTSMSVNLRYKIKRVDASTAEIALGAGGAQLTVEQFSRGFDWSSTGAAARARFRVENVLEELDSPGEWYFDATTNLLYLLPLDPTATLASMASLTLEIPLLRQLVRVSGSRDNVYTAAAHASHSLVETASAAPASNLVFRQLVFSGTQLLTSDVYDTIPGSPPTWPMARVGAVFMETVANVTVEHCAFDKMGGNAVLVSGESDGVSLRHNNISFVGSSGIAILSRSAFVRNSLGRSVLVRQLYSRFADISFNQIHHVGRRVAHSIAILVAGAAQTTVDGNLIYAFPADAARGYWIVDADGSSGTGAASEPTAPSLIRGADATLVSIPHTLAVNLSTAYETFVAVSSPGFDIPVVAKLIGAPECPSGSGRVGSLYGEQEPFTATQCSGCCSTHSNAAKIRVAGSGVPWAEATSREVELRPGESLELQAMSAASFNAITDVYLGFHVVTPNQILELGNVRAKWTIRTRKCQYAEQIYAAECFGPCASSSSSSSSSGVATGCGNSNVALQLSRDGALQCKPEYEPDVHSLACSGPFEAFEDCDASGAAKSHLYYNCSINCSTTTCT